jgi:hypothetical protein
MSSPSLQVFGIQPTYGYVSLAAANALRTTQQLAAAGAAASGASGSAYSTAGSTILAATGAMTPASVSTVMTAHWTEQQKLAQVRKLMEGACWGPKVDPAACSLYSQLYAAADAQRSCPTGSLGLSAQQEKMQSSIEGWLRPPTYVSPSLATTRDTAAVAVAMGGPDPTVVPVGGVGAL